MTTKNFVVKNGLTTGNIILDASSSNITANVVVANLSVPSSANLGAVGNIIITGGSADYVLTTDGAGTLSWAAQSGGGSSVSTTISVDNFTGNGVADTYTLSVTPTSVNSVFVNYNGAFVGRGSYSVDGANLTFGSVPANGASIEVTTIEGLSIGSGSFVTRTATGDNSTVNYTVTSGTTVSSVLVTIDGVLQTPTTDYTISGSTLTFTTAPHLNGAIQIRELAVASSLASTGYSYQEATSSRTVVAGKRYIVNTSSTAITLTLPASPTLGDEIGIIDGTGNANSNNITVARNGQKIQGLSQDMTVNTPRSAFVLVYYNTAQGWLLTQV